jgi:hypothetical protein
MAKHNFSNYLVRNFDINIDQDPHGLNRMLISGFLSYDEAQQYAHQLYSNEKMTSLLKSCRSLIVSEANLPLLGTTFSYKDYEVFFEKELAPIKVTDIPLLEEPENVILQEEEEEEPATEEEKPNTNTNNDDDLFNDSPAQQNSNYMEFDDDFFH